MSTSRAIASVLCLLPLATGVVGCAQGSSASAPSTETVPASADSYSADDALRLFESTHFDYNVVDSTAALAEASTLVITGTLNDVRDGRTETVVGTDDVISTTIILELSDVSPLAGEQESSSDGHVYIEMQRPGPYSVQEIARALPTGAQVIGYLSPGPEGGLAAEETDTEIRDPDAGRPDGQPLYVFASPQGFALQVGDHDVVWPLLGATTRGDIAIFAPSESTMLPE